MMSCSWHSCCLQAGWPRGAACSWAGSPQAHAPHAEHCSSTPQTSPQEQMWALLGNRCAGDCSRAASRARLPAALPAPRSALGWSEHSTAKPGGKGIREAFPDHPEVNSFKVIIFISQLTPNTSIQPEKALDLLAIRLYSRSFCQSYRIL